MLIWSKVAKKELANIDYRYQQRIKSRLADLGDRTAPRPDVRNYLNQRIITVFGEGIIGSFSHVRG